MSPQKSSLDTYEEIIRDTSALVLIGDWIYSRHINDDRICLIDRPLVPLVILSSDSRGPVYKAHSGCRTRELTTFSVTKTIEGAILVR